MRVMEALWASSEPQSVRAVHDEIVAERDLAYTTILTVLDRLAKKGRVERTRAGRAWFYSPAASRAVMVAEAMVEELTDAAADRAEALDEFVRRLTPTDVETLSKLLRSVRSA